MKSLKHHKYKNTGVLFELLVRQLTADTLNNTESKAIPIIKKFFGKNTELAKELNLYQTLVKEKFTKEAKANHLIEAVITSRKAINNTILERQKYNLIKEIKNNYILEDFFNAKVNNYKVLASIYKVFEYSVADNPVESVNSKFTIAEHILGNTTKKSNSTLNEMATFINEDKDVRLMAYQILVDKFNEKYSNLDSAQKGILKEYINNVSDTVELRAFTLGKVKSLKSELNTLSKKVSDKVVKIKLTEVSNLLDTIASSKSIKESQILSLLRYCELVKELKKL